MKGKSLTILAVAAVLLVSLAILSRQRSGRQPAASPAGKILPGLAVNEVQSFEIRTPSGTTTVARLDGLWRIAEKFQYPADFDKVRSLLNKLASLKSLRTLETTPQQRADLHLVDGVSEPAKQPSVITLRNSSGGVMETLVLGKERLREGEGAGPYGGYPDSRFVATRSGTIHLAGETLEEAMPLPRSWMDEEFISIPAEEILSLEVTGTTNGAIRLTRTSGTTPFTLPSIPEGREADETRISRLTSALAYLRFDDVADPKADPAALGLQQPVRLTASTSKGVTCTIQVGQPLSQEGKRPVTVTLSHTPPALPADPAASTNNPATTLSEQNAKTAADVARLSGKLRSWTYVLGKYEAESLILGYSDLLKDKSAPGATPETIAKP